MATNLPCDNHADRFALLLLTNLELGETATLCLECTSVWCQAMVAGLEYGPDPGEAESPQAEELGIPGSHYDEDDEGPHNVGGLEVAQPEPETPTPDASPKRPPAEAATEAEEPEQPEPAAQETKAASH